MIQRRLWIEPNLSALTELIRKGENIEVAARILGRTQGAILAKAQELGLPIASEQRGARDKQALTHARTSSPFSRILGA